MKKLSKNKRNLNTIAQLIVFLMVSILVIGIGFFILDKVFVDMKLYYEQTCDEMNGILVTYSGCNCGRIVECGCEKVGGTYCKLNNGTEIDITIRNAIN